MSDKIDWTTLPPIFAGEVELFNTNSKSGLSYGNRWEHVTHVYNIRQYIDQVVPNYVNYKRFCKLLVVYTDNMNSGSAASLLRIQKLDNWQSELLEFRLPITWGDFISTRHAVLDVSSNAWIFSQANHAAIYIQATQSGSRGIIKAIKLLCWYEKV